jgi:hypothetical protein
VTNDSFIASSPPLLYSYWLDKLAQRQVIARAIFSLDVRLKSTGRKIKRLEDEVLVSETAIGMAQNVTGAPV